MDGIEPPSYVYQTYILTVEPHAIKCTFMESNHVGGAFIYPCPAQAQARPSIDHNMQKTQVGFEPTMPRDFIPQTHRIVSADKLILVITPRQSHSATLALCHYHIIRTKRPQCKIIRTIRMGHHQRFHWRITKHFHSREHHFPPMAI